MRSVRAGICGLVLAALWGCSDGESPRDAGPADLGGSEAAVDLGRDAAGPDAGADSSNDGPQLDGPEADQAAPATGWALSAGGTAEDRASRVVIDSKGNIYVAGTIAGSAKFGASTLTVSGGGSAGFLYKLNQQGLPQWAQPFGTSCTGLAIDGKDNLYLAGSFEGTVTLGSKTLTSVGYADVFVAKLDGAGKVLWAAQGGGAFKDEGSALAVDGAGNTYVAGLYVKAASFGSTTLTVQKPPPAPDGGPKPADLGGPALPDSMLPPPPPPPPDGGAAPDAGTAFLPWNTFVAKLDSAGTFVWATGASVWTSPRGLAADGAGNVYVSGYVQGTAGFGAITRAAQGVMDMYAAKLDKSGTFLWVTTPGKTNDGSKGYDAATDAAGNVYITGSFGGTTTFGSQTLKAGLGSGGSDMFVARLTPADGSFAWVSHAGGMAVASARGLTVDGAGNVYVTGYHQGLAAMPATFDQTKLVSNGYSDVYVAKLDTKGAFLWAVSGGGVGHDVGYGVAVDGKGGVVATGYFGYQTGGSAKLGASTLASQGKEDAFVWRVK